MTQDSTPKYTLAGTPKGEYILYSPNNPDIEIGAKTVALLASIVLGRGINATLENTTIQNQDTETRRALTQIELGIFVEYSEALR